jgi:hypothetical protein
MATCPRCKGHLTDSHHCPRRPAVVALEVILAAVIGAFAGLLIVAVFDPRGEITDIDTLFVIGGALAGIALSRTLR